MRRRAPLTLVAPSRATRTVWLAGAAGCLIFLYAVAVSAGWLTGRLPRPGETALWLVPLLLAGLSLGLALGGVRLEFFDDSLRLYTLWPNRRQQTFTWSSLRYARFFEAESRSRERLYAVRFVFDGADLTLRLADEQVWLSLRERFMTV